MSLTVRAGPNGQCEVYWLLTKVSANDLLTRAVDKLKKDIEKAGGVQNISPDDLPEVHIRADIDTPYRCIGGTIFTMQRAGFPKVGFISQPAAGDFVARRL